MAELIADDMAGVEDRVVRALEAGHVVVLPTDTVYGLAALASRPDAVARIFELKERPPGMHLAVLVSGVEQLSLVTTDDRPSARRVIDTFWPGPLTAILAQATPEVEPLGPRDGTVGVRCPDHDLLRRIAGRVGPIATTSANLHGRPTPRTAQAIADQLAVDLVIDGGACGGGVASTVVDLTGDLPVIVRAGPIGEAAVLAAWDDGGPRAAG